MFLALLFGFISGALLVLVINVLAVCYWLRLKPKEDPKLVPKRTNVCNPKVSGFSTFDFEAYYQRYLWAVAYLSRLISL